MSDANASMSLDTPNFDFGLSLLKQEALNESLVFSPVSIALALALVHIGAKGESKEQIRKAIYSGGSDDLLISYYSELSKSLFKSNDQVQIDLANRLFLGENFEPLQVFLDEASSHFAASAENVNFKQQQSAADTINAFVSKVTKNKISEIVTADSLQDAVAVIVNALYFKAEWSSKFYPDGTRAGQFYSAENREREVTYMKDSRTFRPFTEDDNVQVLSLPYRDHDYALTIFLPKEKYGLSSFIASLTSSSLDKYLSSLKRTYITATIPKFKTETDFPLKVALQKLGLADIFTDRADLSGISGANNLKVGDAKHKALIEVDEEGTVAAAATSIKIVPKMGVFAEVVQFTADHPFLYCLTYKKHPLFVGIYV